jgi:hypothetical protein
VHRHTYHNLDLVSSNGVNEWTHHRPYGSEKPYVTHTHTHTLYTIHCNMPSTTTQSTMLLCYYATALLCYYATVLLCYYATVLLCYYATVLLCYYATVLLCCYATMLLYYYATMLLCHYATMLLYYYAAMLLYYYATVLTRRVDHVEVLESLGVVVRVDLQVDAEGSQRFSVHSVAQALEVHHAHHLVHALRHTHTHTHT